MDFMAYKILVEDGVIYAYEGNAPRGGTEGAALVARNGWNWSYTFDGPRTVLTHRTGKDWPAFIQIKFEAVGKSPDPKSIADRVSDPKGCH
jgi:hypothetical protein